MIQDDNFILFSDVKRLFIRYFRIIILGALIFGGIGFWARTQVPVKYEMHALFKDGGKTPIAQMGMFEHLLKNMSMGGERQGNVLMMSSFILEPIIRKLGLQAAIQSESNWQRKKRCFFESLSAEKRKPFEQRSAFIFENICYLESFPKSYLLYFCTNDTFELIDHKGHTLCKGEVGTSTVLDQVAFTLKAVPDDIKLRTHYPLVIQPLQEVELALRSQIEITQNISTPDVLELTLLHSDLFFGKQVLNLIMEEYQNYLICESERISKGQITYLEKRRNELCMKMNEYLQSHVAYLKKNLQEKGSVMLGQSLPILQEQKDHFSKDLMDLKLKRGKLKNGEAIDLGQEMVALQTNLRAMMKERDALSLALFKTSPQTNDIAAHFHTLDQVGKETFHVQTGIKTFFENLVKPIQDEQHMLLTTSASGTIFLPALIEIKNIEKRKKELIALTQKNFYPNLTNSYLAHNIRLLSLQEAVMKKRLLAGATKKEEYRGIDIHTARQLLLDYLHKRDDLLYKCRQMEFGKNQLEKEEAEHISLAEIFSDSVSQGLVRELGEITQTLRKKRAFTEREMERLEKNFASKKEDLILHMTETIDLTLLEKERIDEQIHAVQIAILDLVGQEIALIERQVEERIDEKLRFCNQEEQLIHKELERLKNEMAEVPDCWLLEKELTFHADMTQGMLEALVQLVESKSIENNLSLIESKPINAAYASFIPNSPLLKVFGLVGALIGGFITFMGCVIVALFKGCPIGLKNLATRGRKVVGTLRNHPEKDLEVFRNLSLILHEQNHFPLIVSLILGKGADYSSSFATLLLKEGKRLLVIDLNFSHKVQQNNLPGLMQYLEGKVKEPAIQKKDFGDTISLEGHSSYAQELLKSQKFAEFLDEMKKNYDVVLLTLHTVAKQAFPKHFFTQSDVIALRLSEESYDELIPYLKWEDERHALAFLG